MQLLGFSECLSGLCLLAQAKRARLQIYDILFVVLDFALPV